MFSAPSAVLVGFVTWSFVAAGWSPATPSSFASGVGLMAVVAYATTFVARYGLSSFTRLLAVTSAAFVVSGVLRALLDPDVANPLDDRLSGFAHNPTNLGVLCAVMVAAALVGFRGRVLVVSAFVIGGGGVILLAQARTAGLATLAILLVVAAREHAGAKRFFAAVGAVAITTVTTVIIAVGDIGTEVIARDPTGVDIQTFTGRTDLWRVASGFFGDRPVIGHGLGSSWSLYEQALADGLVDWSASDAHNVFVQSLIELGLVGAGLLVLFSGTYIWVAMAHRDPRRDAIAMVVFVTGVTEAQFQESTIALIALAGAAAAAGSARSAALARGRVDTCSAGPLAASHREWPVRSTTHAGP